MFVICLIYGILIVSILMLLVYNLSNLMEWLEATFGEKSFIILMTIIFGTIIGMLLYVSCISC